MFPRPQPLVPGDNQAKFIQERIKDTERQLGDLCQTLSNYAKNYAKLRDQTDDLAQMLTKHADSEEINKSSSECLQEFASTYTMIADNREIFLKRMEANIIEPFSPVGAQCREVRDDVKLSFSAKEKELIRRRSVEKIRQRNPRNRQKILMAETELARASADVSRTLRSLEEQMDNFESLKIGVTRKVLKNLVVAEIALHTKEIELLTKAYDDLQSIDEEQDLEEFRKALRTPTVAKEKKSNFRSIANLFMGSSKSTLETGSTSKLSKSMGNLSSHAATKKDEKSVSRRSLSDHAKVKKLNSENESDETDATISTDEEDEEPPLSDQRSKLAKMFIK